MGDGATACPRFSTRHAGKARAVEGATDGLLIPRVVACPTHQCAIFMGNGDGTFQPRVDYASPYRPATGDFNGDERLDIVTVNQSNDNVSILFARYDRCTLGHQSGISSSVSWNQQRSAATDAH